MSCFSECAVKERRFEKLKEGFFFFSTGCLLGLALVLSAMCSEGQTEQRVYVCRTLDRLLDNLQNSGGQGRMLQEVREPSHFL